MKGLWTNANESAQSVVDQLSSMSVCQLEGFSILDGAVNCTTNPLSDTSSPAVAFFNDCKRDPWLGVGLGGYIGAELRTWFVAHNVLLAVLLSTLLLPYFQLSAAAARLAAAPASETLARLHFDRFQASQLLYRVAFVFALCVWLQPVIQQAPPCVCDENASPTLNHHAMPDADSAALMMLSAFLIEHLSVPIGILLPLLFAAAQVITGFYSIGQVVTGLAIGCVMHLLQTRTPGFVRIVEFALSLIGSVVAFVLVKRFDATVDVSQGALAFSGALWQLAALLMPVIWFDWSLVKEALRKAPSTLHPVDFLYYVPLLEASVQFNLTEPEQDLAGNSKLLRKERRLLQTTLLLSALMILLAGVRVAQPHLNDWFVTKA
jgi:hypothetical protein